MPSALQPKNPEHQPIIDAANALMVAAMTLVSQHHQHLVTLDPEDRFLFTDASTAAVTAGDAAATLVLTLTEGN